MITLSFFLFTFSVATGLKTAIHGTEAGNKRDASLDHRPLPVVAGGGRLSRSGSFPRDSTTELLETDQEPLPESYLFLTNEKYKSCVGTGKEDQGSCNTCWAFATQKMVQARVCKWRADGGDKDPFSQLSPLNIICKVQDRADGMGVCSPKSIQEALEFARDTGILSEFFLQMWISNPKLKTSLTARSLQVGSPGFKNLATLLPDVKSMSEVWFDTSKHVQFDLDMMRTFKRMKLTDISKPTDKNCEEVFDPMKYKQEDENNLDKAVTKVSKIMASSAPFTEESIKRRIFMGGPVIGVLRLSWEFLLHKGSLFDPPGQQTFCRMYKAGDPEDFCDPSKASRWDQEQKDQQLKPAGVSQDDFMETWYNHFIVLHGWGKTPSGVSYLAIENSWGRIYRNDVSLHNNGAGHKFDTTTSNGLNFFTLVATRVAGRGGLEITTREVYSAAR